MTKNLLILILVIAGYLALPCSTNSQEENTSTEQWHNFQKVSFKIKDRNAYVVLPDQVSEGSPWVWRARFPNYHFEMDVELLRQGFHVGYVDVAGLFGNTEAMEIGDAFYRHMTEIRNLAKTPALEGVSRGGLFVYNWAIRNPDKVACIYCDTPVLDIKSWPAGNGSGLGHLPTWQECANAYGLTLDQTLEYEQNPVDQAQAIAKADLPLLHIVSETDRVVPPAENTYLLQERLEEFGLPLKILSVETGTESSHGHHFTHPKPEHVVEFIVKHARLVPQRRSLLENTRRVVFLGDSITYSGEYVAIFESWFLTLNLENTPTVINVGLPSETVSGLSEEGHAGGRFPRPELEERLDRVLKETQPDLVFACYGINCGIYQPFDQDRFAKFQQGVNQLRKKVESAGGKLILITPPTFDDKRGGKEFSYNDVLGKYALWIREQKQSGQLVIDLHNAMSSELKRRRIEDPEFTFQPDSVHPNSDGHWFIASQIISWFGDERLSASGSLQEMIHQGTLTDKIHFKVHERMILLRDAYLTRTGHLRPGINEGLPMSQANEKTSELTAEIKAALGR